MYDLNIHYNDLKFFPVCTVKVTDSVLSPGGIFIFLVLGGSIHNLKENAEALVAATREIGLEASADKTKCMVMS